MSLKARMELLTDRTVYRGVVRAVAPFGLFVEIVEGQKEGLLRFEQTPYPEIARQLQVGQVVDVITSTVDIRREAVQVQLLPDPTRYEGFWNQSSRPESTAVPDCGSNT